MAAVNSFCIDAPPSGNRNASGFPTTDGAGRNAQRREHHASDRGRRCRRCPGGGRPRRGVARRAQWPAPRAAAAVPGRQLVEPGHHRRRRWIRAPASSSTSSARPTACTPTSAAPNHRAARTSTACRSWSWARDQPKVAVEFDYADESDGVNHATGQSYPFYPIPEQAITEPYWIEGGPPGQRRASAATGTC